MDTNVFYHVPRTAGSSFLDMLFRSLGRDAVLDTFVMKEPAAFPKQAYDYFSSRQYYRYSLERRAPFTHVHIPVPFHRFIAGNVRYFTLLREPRNRLISYYKHCMHQGIVHQGTSLQEFLERYRKDIAVNNAYTHFLANLERKAWRWKAYSRPQRANGVLLERAVTALGRFIFVGITESFDESVDRFCRLYEFRPDAEWTKRKTEFIRRGPRKIEVSIEEETLLEELTRFDRVIYQRCLLAFKEDRRFVNRRQ